MLQVYPIFGQDVQEVYGKLNTFLAELAMLEIVVPLENIRANTKFYPDYLQTATTIEVCIDCGASPSPFEIADQVRELHRKVVEPPVVQGDDFDPFLVPDENLP